MADSIETSTLGQLIPNIFYSVVATVTSDPPFDPPYKTNVSGIDGPRWVETRIDGTQAEVQADRPMPSRRSSSRDQPMKPAIPGRKTYETGVSGLKAFQFLDVSFADKDLVKRLGGRWDPALRKWYVPHGVDINLFSQWWPETLKMEMKSFGKL